MVGSFSLSVCHYVCLFVCLAFCVSICLSVILCVCLLTVYMLLYLSSIYGTWSCSRTRNGTSIGHMECGLCGGRDDHRKGESLQQQRLSHAISISLTLSPSVSMDRSRQPVHDTLPTRQGQASTIPWRCGRWQYELYLSDALYRMNWPLLKSLLHHNAKEYRARRVTREKRRYSVLTLTKVCPSNSLALGRSEGSGIKHCWRNSLASSSTSSGYGGHRELVVVIYPWILMGTYMREMLLLERRHLSCDHTPYVQCSSHFLFANNFRCHICWTDTTTCRQSTDRHTEWQTDK